MAGPPVIVPPGKVVVVNLVGVRMESHGRTLPPSEPVLMDSSEWDGFRLYDLPDIWEGRVVDVYRAGTEAPYNPD